MGFDADIVELSNLRGEDVQVRSIYKPENGSSVADLRMHWDGVSCYVYPDDAR